MSDLPEPVPAATLVLMREAKSGPPQLLVMERTGHMAFAAGALVFPGGRIDAEDHEAAELVAGTADSAARLAAIRETIEETGIAPAVAPPADPALALKLRDGIAQGRPLLDLLAEHGLALDLESLTPFARWCPNFRETRRFDTLFFLAEIDSGRAHAIFPTRRNLERLARFGSIEEARADAARHPVSRITPWVENRDGAPHVCIPDNIGYPVTSEPLETARRR